MNQCDCKAIEHLVGTIRNCLDVCDVDINDPGFTNPYRYALLAFIAILSLAYLFRDRLFDHTSESTSAASKGSTSNTTSTDIADLTTSTTFSTSTSSTTPTTSTDLSAPTDYDPSSYSMSDLTVIGITGRKRSGKDTSGARLVEEHGFIRIAFADALKDAAIIIFGLSHEQVYGDDLKEVVDDYWGYSPREILQKVGSEVMRDAMSQDGILPKIGKDIWIKSVERKIRNYADNGYRKFVITDVRFPNEIDFIRDSEFNGKTLKVVRESIMQNEHSAHVSEIHIDKFECDFEINNDKSIEDLHSAVDDVARMTEHTNGTD